MCVCVCVCVCVCSTNAHACLMHTGKQRREKKFWSSDGFSVLFNLSIDLA